MKARPPSTNRRGPSSFVPVAIRHALRETPFFVYP